MKVIHELIGFFHSHGVLTESQLAYLRRQGFWFGDSEDEEDDPPTGVAPDPAEAPDAVAEDRAVHALERAAPPRRARSGIPLGAEPAIGDLCRRLAGLSARWAAPLQGFVDLARRLRPCASWEQAVVLLRGAAAGQLASALRDGLDTGAVTIGALDRALDLHDYRAGVIQPLDHSPAANAWRALLAAPDWRASGKHAWILRHPPMDRVFNLVQAKPAVLGALAELYRTDGERLGRHLRGHSRSSLFWAFVLLYNAEAEPEARRCEARWYWSGYPGPRIDEALFPRAGLYAVWMRPQPVLPFLLGCPALDRAAGAEPASFPTADWAVPALWTYDSEKYRV
jgi:hypothetical protein